MVFSVGVNSSAHSSAHPGAWATGQYKCHTLIPHTLKSEVPLKLGFSWRSLPGVARRSCLSKESSWSGVVHLFTA